MGKILEMSKGKSKWLDATLPYAGEERAIVENHTVEMTSSSGCTTANITDPDTGEYYKIVAGKKYRVIWDGVEYICTGFISVGEGTALEQSAVSDNGTNSPEKFEIETRPLYKRTTGFGYNDESYPATHTFSIYEIIKEAREIDRKCLPEGYPYRETVEVSESLINGSNPENMAEDYGVSYFLLVTSNSALFAGVGTKLRVTIDDYSYTGTMQYAKLTDAVEASYLGNLGIDSRFGMPDTGEPFCMASLAIDTSALAGDGNEDDRTRLVALAWTKGDSIGTLKVEVLFGNEVVHTMDGELLPTEEWEFELEDGSTVTKKVVVAE